MVQFGLSFFNFFLISYKYFYRVCITLLTDDVAMICQNAAISPLNDDSDHFKYLKLYKAQTYK